MVKFCERTDTFLFSWEQVARAFWFRYPNPYAAHVQTEDVLHRRITDGKLYTKRLLTKTVRFTYPQFLGGKSLVIKNEPIIEESIIDPKNKTIITYTRNIGVKTAVVEERCSYKQHGEKQTLIERRAWISSSKFCFSRAIESYVSRRFKKTINRTCLGLQHVLEAMFPSSIAQESKTISLIDKEKFCEKAKKATELAKSRAAPLLAAYRPNNQ